MVIVESTSYPGTTKECLKQVIKKGYITTLRITRGDAIDGACGQLVGDLKNTVKGKGVIEHTSIH